MPNTFTLIASSTVGAGGAASILFSSIPGTYTDLCIKVSSRDNASGGSEYVSARIRFNGTSVSADYNGRFLYGTGAAAASSTRTSESTLFWSDSTAATANTFSNVEIYIPNYAAAINKSFSLDTVTENNATTALAALAAGLWSQTSAITSITLEPSSGSFVQYSTAYLYGIVKS